MASSDSAKEKLSGKVAVITGASMGIGEAIVDLFVRQGAQVVLLSRDSGRLEAARARIGHLDQTLALACDVRHREEIDRVIGLIMHHFHRIDIWINNAGADILTGDAARLPFERKLQELLAVDLTATIRLSREVGGRMKSQGHGVLLNMGWDQAETGMEGDSGQLFGSVKAGVIAFSKSLALTLAPQVRVNCLAPGWIRTAWGTSASEHWQERVCQETPLDRWGTPEDVAAVARWLVSPAAAFITGQVIRVNGGAVR